MRIVPTTTAGNASVKVVAEARAIRGVVAKSVHGGKVGE